MKHPALARTLALLDDARTLLVDLVDERPADATPKDLNSIDAARQFINGAIPHLQAATSEVLAAEEKSR